MSHSSSFLLFISTTIVGIQGWASLNSNSLFQIANLSLLQFSKKVLKRERNKNSKINKRKT
jgi:hypothetical protein